MMKKFLLIVVLLIVASFCLGGATYGQTAVDSMLTLKNTSPWGIPSAGACTLTLTEGVSGTLSIAAAEYGPSTGGVDNMVNLQRRDSSALAARLTVLRQPRVEAMNG